MLDTIGLRSPVLSEKDAKIIERECVSRQGIELKTGELVYSITTGSLQGSFDSRISIKVEREQWKADGGDMRKVPCPPQLYVEASVHKAMIGHNVFGGPSDFSNACHWLINLVSELIEVELPFTNFWEVRRVDVAEVYQLDSFEAVQEYMRGLAAAEYPRRQVAKYGFETVYAPGRSTTLKFYHKGPEYRKHDFKRVKGQLGDDLAGSLQLKANCILRVEVEIKVPKLEYDFGHVPKVIEMTDDYLNSVHDVDVRRMIREGADSMKQVREALTVKGRLVDVYGDRLGTSLLGTWYQLATLGEKSCKDGMSRPSFYRHRKLLTEAGCSWKSTDVVLKNFSLVPSDFSPIRSDARRLVEELPEVTEKLSHWNWKVS